MNIVGRTDVGLKREKNEDAFYVSEGPVGMFDRLLVLADGMGGHEYGEIASQTSVRRVVEYVRDAGVNMPLFVLEQAVYEANLAVRKVRDEYRNSNMGTTLVIAGIVAGHVYVMNVGDSRLYLLNSYGESIRQITRDHSYVDEMVARGQMTRNSEVYKAYKNVITRAIGIYAEVSPDAFDFSIEEGDMLLLCSDGLSNMLKNNVIKNLALDRSFDLEKRVETMIEEANRAGGRDNITVILTEGEANDD